MVTFLDITLFQYFNVIFPILLIFAVLFALLQKTKILGENVTINAIISIAVALMSLLSPDVISLINYVAPWFVLVFIFVILLLLVYQLLGATEKDILSALKGDKTIQWTVFGIALVILVAGFAHIWGERMLALQGTPEGADVVEEGEPGFKQNLYTMLFSPKVLGVIFIFLIAIFTIAFLSG